MKSNTDNKLGCMLKRLRNYKENRKKIFLYLNKKKKKKKSMLTASRCQKFFVSV